MAEQGQNPSGGQSGEQKFNAPPPQEISLRTMSSDNASIQRGDATPVPESVLPPETEKEPVFRPETQIAAGIPMLEEEHPKGGKGWLWIVLALVVVGLGAVGYFVIYPSISTPPAPQPPPVALPPPAPAPHTSFFFSAPPSTVEVKLNNLLHQSIITALANVAVNKLADGTVQEVVILDEQNNQTPFGSFLAAFLPTLSSAQLTGWFEDDFTAFLYYDANGIWPGLVARVKPAVNIDEIKVNMAVIESPDLPKNFYLTGGLTFGAFKDGQLNGRLTRYAAGSKPGAALNYGFLSGYFVVSSSYDGLKAAAPLLGI